MAEEEESQLDAITARLDALESASFGPPAASAAEAKKLLDSKVGNLGKSMPGKRIGGLANSACGIFESLSDVVGGAGELLGSAADAAEDALGGIGDAVGNVTEGIGDAVGDVTDAFGDATKGAEEAVSGLLSGAGELDNVVGPIMDEIKNITSGLEDASQEAIEQVSGIVDGIQSSLTGAMDDVFGELDDALSSATDVLTEGLGIQGLSQCDSAGAEINKKEQEVLEAKSAELGIPIPEPQAFPADITSPDIEGEPLAPIGAESFPADPLPDIEGEPLSPISFIPEPLKNAVDADLGPTIAGAKNAATSGLKDAASSLGAPGETLQDVGMRATMNATAAAKNASAALPGLASTLQSTLSPQLAALKALPI